MKQVGDGADVEFCKLAGFDWADAREGGYGLVDHLFSLIKKKEGQERA